MKIKINKDNFNNKELNIINNCMTIINNIGTKVILGKELGSFPIAIGYGLDKELIDIAERLTVNLDNEKSRNKVFSVILSELFMITNNTKRYKNFINLPYELDKSIVTGENLQNLRRVMLVEKSPTLLQYLIKLPEFDINKFNALEYKRLAKFHNNNSETFFKIMIENGWNANSPQYGLVSNYCEEDYIFHTFYKLGCPFEYNELMSKFKNIIDDYNQIEINKNENIKIMNSMHSSFKNPLEKIEVNKLNSSDAVLNAHKTLVAALEQLTNGFKENIKELEKIKIIEARVENIKLHPKFDLPSNGKNIKDNILFKNLRDVKSLLIKEEGNNYQYFGESITKLYIELLDLALEGKSNLKIKNYFSKDKSIELTVGEYGDIVNNVLFYLDSDKMEYSDLNSFKRDLNHYIVESTIESIKSCEENVFNSSEFHDKMEDNISNR